jgi:hypothetical protein
VAGLPRYLSSDTNFATIALALANNAVRTAHTGDFVKIAGDIYSSKTMFINVLVKWFKKTKVHTLSIKLSISKFQIVKTFGRLVLNVCPRAVR